MQDDHQADTLTGELVDMDPKRGTITIDCDGECFVCLWPTESDIEIGGRLTHKSDGDLDG